jgi:hypothetical protein
LSFDTVRTDAKVRKQCFSVSRRADNSVIIHNRDDEEKAYIEKEFFNEDAERLSKTAEMTKRESEQPVEEPSHITEEVKEDEIQEDNIQVIG